MKTDTDNPVQRLANVPCPGDYMTHEDYSNDGGVCPTCHGTGRKHWQLWMECEVPDSHQFDFEHGRCSCQGSGWVLRPEPEWMAVLVGWVIAQDLMLLITADEVILTNNLGQEFIAYHNGREAHDTVAAAIFQAQGGGDGTTRNLEIDKLKLTAWEQIDLTDNWKGPQATDTSTLTCIIADAQLAKALWGVLDWLSHETTAHENELNGLNCRFLEALEAAGIHRQEAPNQ